MKNWAKDIKADDMPTEDLKLIANQCGIDVAIILIEHLSGLPLYIPASAKKQLLESYIRRNFDGSSQSAKKLAIECGVSFQHIYNVLKMPSSDDPKKKQLSLFG